jgi:ferredoxin--NADP+ reductase
VLLDENGRIRSLRIVENDLVKKGDTTAAKATDQTVEIEFDTLIYAIGDIVDPKVGLPLDKWGSYTTNPHTENNPGAAYEVFDPAAGKVVAGEYVVGWSRKASDGLVGKARFDAEQGCDYILKYLESAPKKTAPTADEIARELARRGLRAVDKGEIKLLARAEEAEAKARNLPAFKYPTNEQMLEAIEKEKSANQAA